MVMKIKELFDKVKEAKSKNPDADVGIWMWEQYGVSPKYDSCAADKAEIVEIFGGTFVISCDKKISKNI